MAKPVVAIVTPAWADANNGNWQTARRWARHVAAKHTVVLIDQWPHGRTQVLGPGAASLSDQGARALAASAQVLMALHARRSAASIQAWHQAHGSRGLAVVLTGTDLYKDLHSPDHATAQAVQQSLAAAQSLVVLQDQALQDLPLEHRHKAQLIFQSTTARRLGPKPDLGRYPLRAVMVGHLREEKDPNTLQQAARLLQPEPLPAAGSRTRGARRALDDSGTARLPPIRIDHLGDARDPELASAARATQAACPGYRWLGACTHEQARTRIQRAHVLVHTSRLEGGAHVIMEAVRSGTPVIASRMAGNVGMLGQDYAGYFPVGDAAGLATALQRFQVDADFRATLQQQCHQRAALFEPAREAQCLHTLIQTLRGPAASPGSMPLDLGGSTGPRVR